MQAAVSNLVYVQVIYIYFIIMISLYIYILLCREDRAAKALLVTAQYNQKFGHSSKSPEFPEQMMSQDRKTRVCVIE